MEKSRPGPGIEASFFPILIRLIQFLWPLWLSFIETISSLLEIITIYICVCVYKELIEFCLSI